MNNPYLEVPDLRAEYETLWIQFANRYALAQRIAAELKGQSAIDQSQLTRSPVPAATLKSIVSLANDELKARLAAYQSEKRFHLDAIGKEEGRVDLVQTTRQREGDEAKLEAAELERLRAFKSKGYVPNSRLTEMRRSSHTSETHALQSGVQLVQAERARDDLKLKLSQFEDQYHIRLLADLQVANVNVEASRLKLEAVGEKFEYVGMVKSQLTSGRAQPPSIRIIRLSGEGRERIIADEDTKLAPGDVLEISLDSPGVPLAAR